jgi:outer membrane biosynthesis protein TonB
MFILRERVRRRWFVPEAFNLGLVSGRVIVTFKIMPDGEMRDLEVMSYRDNDVAYQSLVNASVNAIEVSNPFPPLPVDFLHPFLEITGTFYYQILGFE